MFDHDRSAARGEMSARKLIVFKHESPLGNGPVQDLFKRVAVHRSFDGESYDPGDRRTHNLPPARAFQDYGVTVDRNALPAGVDMIEIL